MSEKSLGTLFVCATPIGNLADASFRLIETLKSADIIAAEDTRHTKILLSRYEISKPLLSLQKFNERERVAALFRMLNEGKNVALVSDAGTPALADPGAIVVSELSAMGVTVSPVPGPSALTALISAAGIEASGFYFGGFFARKEGDALALLEKLRGLDVPIFFLESPKRIARSLKWIAELFPEAYVVAGKELTKKFEKIFRGRPAEVLAQIEKTEIKGEWSFILSLPKKEKSVSVDAVAELKAKGFSLSQVLYLAEKFLDLSRNVVYKEYHR